MLLHKFGRAICYVNYILKIYKFLGFCLTFRHLQLQTGNFKYLQSFHEFLCLCWNERNIFGFIWSEWVCGCSVNAGTMYASKWGLSWWISTFLYIIFQLKMQSHVQALQASDITKTIQNNKECKRKQHIFTTKHLESNAVVQETIEMLNEFDRINSVCRCFISCYVRWHKNVLFREFFRCE